MRFFGVKSAAAIESLAETILPEDDTPGVGRDALAGRLPDACTLNDVRSLGAGIVARCLLDMALRASDVTAIQLDLRRSRWADV